MKKGLAHVEVVKSTQTELIDALHADQPPAWGNPNNYDYFSLSADRQEGGLTTKLTKMWISPRGNLAQSIFIRCDISPLKAGSFAVALGFTLIDVLRSCSARFGGEPMPLKVKWPNDLVVGSDMSTRKVAGILSNYVAGKGVVAGIGVNIFNSPRLDGGGSNFPAGVAVEKIMADQDNYLSHLRTELLEAVVKINPQSPMEQFLDRGADMWHYKKKVVLKDGDTLTAGELVGIEASGALILAVDGKHSVHHSGSLSIY